MLYCLLHSESCTIANLMQILYVSEIEIKGYK